MSRWTEKPPLGSQINWNHPLSKGLVGCWLMNEGAGNKVNDLALRNNGVNNGATWIPTIKNKSLDFNSSYIEIPHNAVLNSPQMTIITWIKSDNMSIAYRGIICKNREPGGGDTKIFGIFTEGAGQSALQFRAGGITNLVDIPFTNTTTWVQLAFTINYNGTCTPYINSFPQTTFTGELDTSGTYNLFFGKANFTGSTEYYDGKLNHVLFYNKILKPQEIKSLYESPYQFIYKPRRVFYSIPTGVTLSGTILNSTTETDIRTGGKQIILTLTGDTWVDSGATFDGQRQNIINGLDSAQSEATGWDAEVKAKAPVTDVVRTDNSIVTITLSAQSGYDITSTETITATVPGSALTGGQQLVATPTFDVTPVSATTSGYMTTNKGFW